MGWLKGCPILLYLMYNNLFAMEGIYLITNQLNGKKYVGQALDIEERWKRHIRDINNYDFVIYRAMRKYGVENFSFEVLEECDVDKLDEREIYWINELDTYNNGYNMTMGGEGRNQGKNCYSDEYQKQYNKQWHQDHKEERKQYKKQYYQDHKEEIKQSSKQWIQDHKEEKKQYMKQWIQDHKEERKQYHTQYMRQYRARKKQG